MLAMQEQLPAEARRKCVGEHRAHPRRPYFASCTSISTSMPGVTNPATCTVERAGKLGCSAVPKYWVYALIKPAKSMRPALAGSPTRYTVIATTSLNERPSESSDSLIRPNTLMAWVRVSPQYSGDPSAALGSSG